jgi:hypothetical protein
MFRKITLGLFAAASLTAVALAPTSASAGGGGWGPGWGGGWGHHHHWHGPAFGIGYVGANIVGDSDCYVTRRVPTPHGWRWRTVNVCY